MYETSGYFGTQQSIPLELDLRFNVVMFGVIRLDNLKAAIESVINFSN